MGVHGLVRTGRNGPSSGKDEYTAIHQYFAGESHSLYGGSVSSGRYASYRPPNHYTAPSKLERWDDTSLSKSGLSSLPRIPYSITAYPIDFCLIRPNHSLFQSSMVHSFCFSAKFNRAFLCRLVSAGFLTSFRAFKPACRRTFRTVRGVTEIE